MTRITEQSRVYCLGAATPSSRMNLAEPRLTMSELNPAVQFNHKATETRRKGGSQESGVRSWLQVAASISEWQGRVYSRCLRASVVKGAILLGFSLFFLSSIPARAADAPATEDDRLRSALREATLQLRTAQADLTNLQTTQAALAAEKKLLSDKYELLKKQAVADKAATDKALAELPLLDRGSSATKTSLAGNQPAYIRMIKRRYTRFCPGICPGIYVLHNCLQKWTEELFSY